MKFCNKKYPSEIKKLIKRDFDNIQQKSQNSIYISKTSNYKILELSSNIKKLNKQKYTKVILYYSGDY